MIGLLVPYTSKGLDIADGTVASSPFVIAIKQSGIKVLPSVREFPCSSAVSYLRSVFNKPYRSSMHV
jgi:amino acid permease